MAKLQNASIEKYLDQLGEASPCPGGGSAAALVAATSASLLSMVVGINQKRSSNILLKRTQELPESSEKKVLLLKMKLENKESESANKKILKNISKTRKDLNSLIDKDALAYKKISKFSKDKRQSPEYQEALKAGASTPLILCETILDILGLIEVERSKTSKWLMSDLLEAGLFSKAAFKAAQLNVEINLKSITDEAFISSSRSKLAVMNDKLNSYSFPESLEWRS